MKITGMLGYKLFKELEDDTIDLVRIIDIFKNKNKDIPELMIKNEGTGEIKKISGSELKGYTPLEPDGLITFNIVKIATGENTFVKDVIVTASKILNIKIGDTLPYAICRQNITDVFYNLLVKDEDDMIVGLSVNRDTCPANFDYGIMLACDEIIYTDSVNIYRTDILEDVLKMVKNVKFDSVLSSLYNKHIEYVQDPNLQFKKEHKGWVKDLKTLLKENNFQEDINQMLGITSINPIIENHSVVKQLPDGEKYTSLSDAMINWLSSIFKINIDNITVIEYGHDINLAEFNNARYFIFRDGVNKLYLAVYTTNGEYHETDLEAKSNEKDFSDEFRINFYNKYNKNK